MNDAMIAKVSKVTSDLSEVIESLLANVVSRAEMWKAARASDLKETTKAWNAFGEKHGSFADEHSTL